MNIENGAQQLNLAEKKFAILTYGCQMNESDSEKFAGQLKSLGCQYSESTAKADIILVNTCCVRESAEKKIEGKIGELKHLKRANPNLLLIVAGCMAQKEQDRLLKKFSHIDLVIGTHNIHRLTALIAEINSDKKRVCQILNEAGEISQTVKTDFTLTPDLTGRENKASAWVPIMYGCDNFCTYCIVPYVRGRERSRPLTDILEEIQVLGETGYKDITLLGQNVNSYGSDNPAGTSFAQLLAAADKIETVERIRYMTSHPRDMSEEIIEVIAKSNNPANAKPGKICQHFHLPVQSGSNAILAAMNRGYTTEYYRALISKIRQKTANASISTDIIVGFPGETEELFEETLEFIQEIGFDAAYTFIYSKRSGTPAAAYEGQVPPDIKKSRLNRLSQIQNTISLSINKKLEGTIQEVLIEGPSKNDPLKYTGRTRTNKIVIWDKTGQEEAGKLANIKIIAAQTWLLRGRPEET